MRTADELLNERRQLVEQQRDLAEEFGHAGSKTDRAVVQFAIDDIDRELVECSKSAKRVRRCENCERHKTACPSPPPDTTIRWGHAECIQLGDYWMHISANDALHLSYGSALSAYESAAALATTEDEKQSAADGYLAAWRCSLKWTPFERQHERDAPVNGCGCPICLDAIRWSHAANVR